MSDDDARRPHQPTRGDAVGPRHQPAAGPPPSADIPPNDAVRQSLEVRSARPGEELSDYQGGTNRRVQVTKRGWNRFDAAKKKVFLKWFAATCNAAEAARRAGVGYSTIFYHRARDARFAEAWDRALEQGYARLEAKLVEMQFEQAAGPAIEFDGAFEPPDAKLTDPEMALQLLKQHKAEVTRIRAEQSAEEARSSRRRKKSRSYDHERLASDAEVRRALIKGLEAFGVRVTAEQEERVRRALSGE